MKTKVRVVRLDAADIVAGLVFGQVLIANLCITSSGAHYFQVKLPAPYKEYYLRADQVEKVSK